MKNPRRDKGHKETDKRLAELERRIKREYEQASREVEKKLDDYLKKFEKKDAIKLQMLADKKITEEDYQKWRKGQILIGKRWDEMQTALAKDMHNANKIAKQMIDKNVLDAYALNHNYGTFEVEKGSLIDTSYTLYSRETVERLIRDNPQLLPPPETSQRMRAKMKAVKAEARKKGKDEAKALKDLLWNKQQVNSIMTQAILQGESVPKIAKRMREGLKPSFTAEEIKKTRKMTAKQVARELARKNQQASIRNARTMTTGAQNAGRRDAYQRAVDLGIEMQEEWIATLDPVTRDSHRDVDGERKEVGDDTTFSNGLRFPGDPYGAPAEVYNCRCVLQGVLKQFSERKASDLSLRYDKKLGGMSYEEWKAGKKGSGE